MAFKKNTAAQITFTMVDKKDFATIRSTVSAVGNLSATLYGVKHGGTTATKVVVLSKVASVVRSGIFRWPIKNTEISDADLITIWIRDTKSNVNSMATQILQYEVDTVNLSGLSDDISKARSDIKSQLTVMNAAISDDISKARSDIKSQMTVWFPALSDDISKARSDIKSQLTVVYAGLSDDISKARSDIKSQITVHQANMSDDVSKARSDIKSQLTVMNSFLRSALTPNNAKIRAVGSDLWSVFMTQRTWSGTNPNTGTVSYLYTTASSFGSMFINAAVNAYASHASDVASAMWAHASTTKLKSRISDIKSMVSKVGSDVKSRLSVMGTATITDGDKTTIASRVWTRSYSDYTTASTIGSMINKSRSRLSDVKSMVSKYYANISDDISKARSDIKSQLTVVYAGISDDISKARSDIKSAIAGVSDDISKARSDIKSQLTVTYNGLSDQISKLKAHVSGVTSDYFSKVSSDLKSAIAAGPAAANTTSIAKAVWNRSYSDHITASTFGSMMGKEKSQLSAIDIYLSQTATASDVASKLWNYGYASFIAAGTAGSLLRRAASVASDTYSLVASRIGGTLATYSSVSKIGSDIKSMITVKYNALSDDISKARSDIKSQLTVVYAGLSDDISKARSDIKSALAGVSDDISKARSDIKSQLTVAYANLSDDISKARSDIKSALTVNYAGISDVQSKLLTTLAVSDTRSKFLDLHTKFFSRVAAVMPTYSQANAWYSDLKSTTSKISSDIKSQITVAYNNLSDDISKARSDIKSQLTVHNAAQSDDISKARSDIKSQLTVIYAGLSDQISKLKAHVSGVTSDYVSKIASDLKSAIAAGPAATVTDGDKTAIASRVWTRSYSDYTTASTIGSMINKTRSRVSDVKSMLSKYYANISDDISKARSDIKSALAGITAVVDYGKVGSHVWSNVTGSDIYSKVGKMLTRETSLYSDLKSAVAQGGLTVSAMSHIASMVWRVSPGSDVGSKITNYVKASLVSSDYASKIYKGLSDDISKARSDIKSQLTVAAANISDDISKARSDIKSAITVHNTAIESQFTYASAVLSDVYSLMVREFNTPFSDADTITANTLRDRIRTMGWIARNRMKVMDATGNVTLFKDNDTTTAYTVTGGLLDDGVSTVRKRLS